VSFAPIDHYDPQTGGHDGARTEVEPREALAIEMLRDPCLREHGSLLDVGCGDGMFLSLIDQRLSLVARGWMLHGIDASGAQIHAATPRPYTFRQCNVEDGIPFADATFSIVFCGELLEHLYDPDSFLGDCRRVLKPRGILAITTPNLQAWYNRLLFLAGIQPLFYETSTRSTSIGAGPLRRLKRGTVPVGHIRIFNQRALRDIVESQGFRIRSMRGAPFVALYKPFHYVDRLLTNAPSLASNFVLTAEALATE